MKKIIIIIIACIGLNVSFAQQKIDRSKPPVAGPAPVIQIGDPVTYKLANGMTLLVVENHKLPKISANYRIDYGPVLEGEKAGVMNLMGGMLNEGTTVHQKAQFDELVDLMGADLSLNQSGGMVSALTRYFKDAFMLFAEAIQKPAFNPASFEKLKSQSITSLKANDKNAKAISARVVNALTYGTHSAEGEFETEQSLNNLKLEDVKIFYSKYITPSRGFLTFVGDITPAEAKLLAEKAFSNWHGSTIKLPVIATVANPSKTEIDLIDVPNAVQSEITVTNLVSLPMNSPDYFPVLIANNILGGNADARLFMNLREKHGYTYGAYSGITSGRYQTTFRATASVRNEKVDSAVIQMLYEINNIRNNKVSMDELKSAKAVYAGNFALGLEDPSRTAAFASNILINDLPKDFYKTYLQRINAVTVDDVQRVAKEYFNYQNTRIIIVGKAAIVQPALAKLNYPINTFDKFAAPTPVELKSVTATNNAVNSKIFPKDIIDKYINAIGGVSELKKISSIISTGDVTVQGMTLSVTKKEMAPNLQLMEMTMNGQTVMKQVYDGTKGYRMQMGNKSDLSGEEIAELKDQASLFPQLNYFDKNYKIDYSGVEKVSGKDAYRLIITSPSGNKSTEFYDVVSGLLVKQDKTVKAQGQEINQSLELSNYKKVGAILYPFTNLLSVQTAGGSQDINIDIKDVKINTGITVTDFK